MNNKRTVIKLDNISKVYRLYNKKSDRVKEIFSKKNKAKYSKEYFALNGINLEISNGEILGFVGENGAGKSTLLKIITEIIRPTQGSVEVNGTVAALLELGAGFNEEYTGYENIYLQAAIMGITKKEIEKQIPSILAFANIGEFIGQPVKTYSSGMFVRLAFSIAINVNPDILIVDEALAVGDLRFQIKCMEKFEEFIKQDKTILFVSHDINSIRRFCTRCVWLKNGMIEEIGSSEIVTSHFDAYLKRNEDDASTSNNCIESGGIASILDFSVLGNKSKEDIKVPQMEPLIIEVEYDVTDLNVKRPVIGISLHTVNNLYVCGLNTLLDDINIPWELGKNKIKLVYPDFNVSTGKYYFDVALFEGTATVSMHYLSKICEIEVIGKYVGEGIVILNHKWEK